MAYQELYPQGSSIKIASRQELEEFFSAWRFHHQLEAKQLAYAGRCARVIKIGFYHGGDVLYELENIPGIWHESCLRPADSN